MPRAECGMPKAELGMGKAECGVWNLKTSRSEEKEELER